MILDGKQVALSIYEDLKENISKLDKKPKLCVILIGDNSASLRYISQKQKWANYIGIDFELIKFDETISEEIVLKCIDDLNKDDLIDGFMVQTPLPEKFNLQKVLNSISPKKDVDGFHPVNQGKVIINNESGLKPCTPAGVIDLLNYYNIPIKGSNIVVIGRSNIVGKPLANMLINLQSTVTICNSLTKNIDFYTKNADIIITAMGKPNFLTVDKINTNCTIIDVGFSIIDGKIYGDCDFENIIKNGNNISPVPGGVGTLTVANLMKNTLKAYNVKNSNLD